MLDIGIVIPRIMNYGGAERFAVECVSRWQDRHQLTLYSTQFDRKVLAEHGVDPGKVRMQRLRPFFEGDHSQLLNGVLLPKIWEQEIGSHQLYHAHQWPTHQIDRHPMVWFPHEPLRVLYDFRYEVSVPGRVDLNSPPDPVGEASTRALILQDRLARPDRIVANSRYSAQYLEDVFGRAVTDVVYPGVNVDDFLPLPIMEDVVMTVGRLGDHKRLSLILEAMQQVEDVQLYVVGSGKDDEKLQRMIQRLGISERTFILDGLNNREVHLLMARCLAVIFVPFKEPFGIVALEAMAAGKPLIAVREGGFTEVVDASCAALVPPEPAAIAEQILFLRQNRELARQMGKAGRARARDFTWDRTARELLAILEDTHAKWSEQQPAAPSPPVTPCPMFGIRYFCDYQEGIGSAGWSDAAIKPRADMAALGHYASHRGAIIESHLRTLEKLRFHFVILNVHLDHNGINARELGALERVFAVAERMGSRLQFCIQLNPSGCAKKELGLLLGRLRRLTRKPSYLCHDGKPVLFVGWTGAWDGDKAWVSELWNHSEEFLRIACSTRPYPAASEHSRTFGLFDGWCLANPHAAAGSAESNWRKAWSDSPAGARNLKIVTLSPGERCAVEPPGPAAAAGDGPGVSFRRMFDFALSLETPPDFIIVSSFNNYRDRTHVETSRNNGGHYLELTQKFIKTARKHWSDVSMPGRAA
jgi:glycosyltransferase involved in cell wall biosynthesis